MASRLTRPISGFGKLLLDFALPPRCAGCAEVIEEVGAFCPACWRQMEWLGNAGCQRCGPAKALRRARADRIELICWPRVFRPAQLMR